MPQGPEFEAYILKTRNDYLAGLPGGANCKTVDGGKAKQLADFFITDMGKIIIGYFNDITTQSNGTPGLNLYKLSGTNYRLWLGIKMLAGKDNNMYACSLAADKSLFAEFVQRTKQQQTQPR